MRVDARPRIGYVRFSVTGVSGSVTRASLRLYATRSYSAGFEVRAVSDNSWDEQSLTWLNRPAVSSAVTAVSGPVTAKSWLSLDVTPLVGGNGTYSFGLTSPSTGSNYLLLATKESGVAKAPQLLVEDTGTADDSEPSMPTGLTPIAATSSSVTLAWTASNDNVGVVDYGVYRDGSFVGSTTETTHTFGGLTCGKSYVLSVDARDAAGNLSPQGSLTIATGSCDDTQPPTAPTGLFQTGVTESSISLAWMPSADNDGVTGYNVYVDEGKLGSTAATLYLLGGLACGRSYTLGVEAYDAAGNVSPRSTVSAATSACSSPSTSYYVDDTGGNDGNAGTSPSAAWRSLLKASSAALQPGDRLLLKRGGTWTESLKLSRSGTGGAPILVASYGSGESPRIGGVGTCVVLAGSNLVVSDLHAADCSWAGVKILGSNNRVEANLITGNAAGVEVEAGALDNAIVRNKIKDNNKMSVLTASPTNDDSGAFGVLVHGDRTEISHNTITGSDAFSYDFGRDGAAIEIYGGRQTDVHHNLAVDNHDFSELGNSRSADNTFSYNVVRSSLDTSTFVITRGAGSSFGPVLRTRLYNNTVLLTGASSQGFVCHAGCSADILTMRANIIQAVWKVGYADAAFDEDNDVFYGGLTQFTKGANSVVANPQFVAADTGNLHLQWSSPAVDKGMDMGQTSDFDDLPVPVDGNGDGQARADVGGYEYRPTAIGPDTTSPSQPSGLAATAATTTSVSLSWTAASDNVGVAGYGLYRNGTLVATTATTSSTFAGLSCGTSYAFAIDAYDAAGNRSPTVSLTVATSPCPDTTPPSAPLNLAFTGGGQTSVALGWVTSTDDVAVAGYGIYRDGILVGTSVMSTATVAGLTCGTSYAFAVDAYDAAGNRSPRASITASTTSCGNTQPPTVSVSGPAAGATVSGAVTLAANASDDVAVTQVKWYVDGVEVAWDADGAPWERSWNSTSVPDGPHQLFAKAADSAGNWGTSQAISFTVSNAAPPPPPPPAPPPPPSSGDPVIAAAGDIACVPGSSPSATTCRQQSTADVITKMNPTAVLNLGDAQYETGTLANFQGSYDLSWGAFKDKTWATAGGSHDFYGGGDWYTYFGSRAGPGPYKPFSFDVGAWHIVSLNVQCSNSDVGGCGVGSSQYNWLKDDLAAHPTQCTLAMWHNARWSSGPRHGTDARSDAFVQLLYDAGAEVILSAHDHNYERFAPQNQAGARDDARGVVQFVVGTGGKWLEESFGTIQPNSLARQRTTFGVLKLTLHPASYDWEFVAEASGSYSDSGSASCH